MGLACSSDGNTKHVYSTSRGSLLQNSHFEDQEHDCSISGPQISGDCANGDGVQLTDAANRHVATMRL